MDDQKNQLIDKLKSATNILVTVSQNPSVDQLAACIGVTLALNKQGKHATAVFSGNIPSTIEFLQPEATIERNTDSLRDFIIALDKSKADKLRYKVEDRVVKIFITPYKTSISDKDLNFSQGDFNVDAVLALGVHEQQDLDQAITSHGRILHDATVLGINQQPGSELASINWVEPAASSLSELTAQLLDTMDKELLDQQIATALLTGVVAATDRFRNDNTTAQTMSVSALLMRAGANQQLVTSQLAQSAGSAELTSGDDNNAESNQGSSEKSQSKHSKKHDKPAKKDPGMLEINHDEAPAEPDQNDESAEVLPEEKAAPDEPVALPEPATEEAGPDGNTDTGRDVMTEPPTFDSALTANDRREEVRYNPAPDMASDQPSGDPLLSHSVKPPASTTPLPATPEPLSQPAPFEPPVAPSPVPPAPSLSSTPATPSAGMPEPTPAQPLPPSPPAAEEAPAPLDQTIDVDDARDEVMRALSEQPDETMPPIAALNAQPLGGSLHDATPSFPPADTPAMSPSIPPVQPASGQSPAGQPLDMPLPPSSAATPPPPTPPVAGNNADAPPSVPPPLMPPNWPPKQ